MEQLSKPIAYEEKDNPELEQDFIFISYCHADKEVIYSDLIRLNGENARFWYDENVYAGDNWLERVTKIINSKHCRGVLFYLSPNSFYSTPMLQEVEIAQNRLRSQTDSDPEFKIASVNLGRKSVFETLRTLNVSEELFRGFLYAFDEKVHFIARYFDPKSDDHLEEVLTFFSELNALPDEFSVVDSYDGVQILKYNGTNSNVIIPSTINSKKVNAIGIHAFEKNESIKFVHISEGVSIIDDFAFYDCKNLERIEFPNSLKIIGYESFCKCVNLKEITIPYNVYRINSHAFYRCSRLSKVSINSIVPLSIKFAAFEECESLSKIEFPDSLKIIEPYTFSNCVSLRRVTLPDGIKEIGSCAFHSCSNLREVHFKPDIVPDNNNIFSRCLSLKAIIIDEGDKDAYIANKTWDDYKQIFKFKLDTPSGITYNNNTIYWKGSSLADNYIIQINGKDVGVTTECVYKVPEDKQASRISVSIKALSSKTENMNSNFSKELIIDQDAFKIFPENGELILNEYTGLEENIIVPTDVTIIDENAFYNNGSLRSIVLPHGLKIIRDNAFYRCKNLERVEFPDTLEEIGNYAFWGTRISGNLTLPRNLKNLGIRPFACCNHITSVTLLSSSIQAERGMFYRCLGLIKVNLPDDFEELYYNMFKGCFELSEITLPRHLKKLSTGSLASLMKLEDITIPASVSEIDVNAFGSSLDLKEIHVDSGNDRYYDYDGILIDKFEKKLVQYPPNHEPINLSEHFNDLKIIGAYGFSDNALIENMILPDSVECIEEHAFERCTGLKQITIGANIEKIGSQAFSKCDNLKKIIIHSLSIPVIYEDSLINLPEDTHIYIDSDTYDDYTRNKLWQPYLSKILRLDIA